MGCPGAFTVISQSLDSKTLPWLAIPANPAVSPHTGTSGHLSHCDNSGEKKGVEEGKQKIKKSINVENTGLKKKQRTHNALPNVVPNSPYTGIA